MSTSKDAFLPGSYKVPDKSRQFLKLEIGDNKIRILTAPVLGFIIFDSNNKPHRKPFEDPFTEDELEAIAPKKNDEGKTTAPKHFWMLAIWSYNEKELKILEVTQASIYKAIMSLFQDEDWGDPRNYDISIKKEGSTKNDTKYSVVPKAPKPVPEKALEALGILTPNLDAIYQNEYPIKDYK